MRSIFDTVFCLHICDSHKPFLSYILLRKVSLAQKSLKQGNGNDAAKGLQMGIIQSCLNAGKVCGAALVVLTYSIHPQAPLWILEGLLITGASLFLCIFRRDL